MNISHLRRNVNLVPDNTIKYDMYGGVNNAIYKIDLGNNIIDRQVLTDDPDPT